MIISKCHSGLHTLLKVCNEMYESNNMIGDDKIAKQNYSVARVVTHNSAYLLGTYCHSQKQYKKAAKWYRLCAELNIKHRNILLKQFYKK